MGRQGTVKQDAASGRWFFVVDISPPGAPRRQLKRRGFAKKREALDALNELVESVRKHTFVEPTSQTLGQYLLDDWLPAAHGSLEPSTWASYDRNLRIHVIPRLGTVPLQALDAAALNKVYAALLEGGRRDQKDGGLSPRTVRYIATILGRALKDAVQWGRLVRNPADVARPPRASDTHASEMRTWSGSELARFLELVEGNRYRSPCFFLATTGCRRGECLGLRWADVDLEAGRVSIRQTVTAVNHRVRIAPRTKTGRGRAVDLDAATVSELRSHHARQAQEMLVLGLRPDGETLVFCHPDGRPYHPERFSREFDRRLDRHPELPRIRLHDLRHTWATLALAAGVPTKIVSDRLGHRTTAITADVYSHVTPTMGTEAAEKVSALIFGTAR